MKTRYKIANGLIEMAVMFAVFLHRSTTAIEKRIVSRYHVSA